MGSKKCQVKNGNVLDVVPWDSTMMMVMMEITDTLFDNQIRNRSNR